MDPRVLVLTPFRNEETAIPFYLAGLKALDYPSRLVDVFWLENDSSDRTPGLLEEARTGLSFRSTELVSVTWLGPLPSREPGNYWKDLAYGKGHRQSFMHMFNDHFLPLARASDVDYVMPWFADCVPLPNLVAQFLEVFRDHPDAGWVGGIIYRRYPRHREVGLVPWRAVYSREVVEVKYTAHCWMMPQWAMEEARFGASRWGGDMCMSLIESLWSQGLKVYLQPSVFLKHISTDGKIHTDHILEDTKPGFWKLEKALETEVKT